jgi:hypothetical protein
MNERRTKLLASAALILTVCFSPAADAQSRRWRSIRGRPLVKFDSNCASASAYPKDELGGVVRALLKRKYADRPDAEAERAFAFDLNGDRKPEYFVPLVCGAVGNCNWGVFALNPSKLLGVINGQYVFVHTRSGRWPDVITYRHMTAAEGTLGTYAFRRGRYGWLGDVHHVGVEGRDSDFWNVPLRKVPDFLDRARSGCEDIEW